MLLNSATGVILPGTDMAPDMTITSLALRNVVDEVDAARAKFVRGPMPIRVIVSGGLEERMSRISRWEGAEEGVNRVVWVSRGIWAVRVAVEESRVSVGGASKRWAHRSG